MRIINKNTANYVFLFFLIFTVLYLIVYYIFITPLFKVHELQTKQWISDLTDNIVLGVNDKSHFEKINRKCDFISFWYCYWFFQTKQYNAWILFNLKNKFSDEITLNVYLFDFYNNKKTLETVPLKFGNVKTSKINNVLVITCGNNYKQEIDFNNNRSTITIQVNNMNIQFDLLIDDRAMSDKDFFENYDELKY